MSQKLVPLHELCNEIYRYPTYYDIKYIEHGVPEIRGTLINDDGTLDESERNWRFISTTTSSKFPRTVLSEGDLVISVRGTIGKIGLVPKSLAGANMTANLIRVSPNKSKVYERYLWRFMRSPQFVADLEGISSSTTIKTLKAPDLKALKIPLPPIAEQKRIAAILDKAEELRGLRRQALKELDAIVQSIFLEMFGDSRITKQHEVVSLSSICNTITDGTHKTPKYVSCGIPFVTVKNIVSGKLDLSETKFISEAEYEEITKRTKPERGDILVSKDGTIGVPCPVQTDDIFSIFVSVALLKLKADLADQTFIVAQLSSRGVQDQIRSGIKGIAIRHLHLTDFKRLKILLPSLPLQQEFARRVEAIEQLKATHRESLAQLDALFASLQHRAFRGEL